MLARFRKALDNWAAAKEQSRQEDQERRNEAAARSHRISLYRATLANAIADGNITDSEIERLESMRLDAGLAPYEVSAMHVSAMEALLRGAMADDELTAAEIVAIDRAYTVLNVDPATIHQSFHTVFDELSVVAGIRAGNLPKIDAYGIVLDDDEHLHISIPSEVHEERVVRTDRRGQYGGTSVRIMRGVSIHTGGTRGVSQSVRQVVPVDSGTLYVTSKKLVFAGSRQTISAPWAKVVAVNTYLDGISFGVTGRKKTVLLSFQKQPPKGVLIAILEFYLY